MASIRSGIGENMEDRYLFKAKDCNSIWRAGLLISLQEGRCAIEEKDGSKWACDSETLCQCTGLKDKNGNLIWENDIMVAHLDKSYPDDKTYQKVIWNENGFHSKAKGSEDIEPIDRFDQEWFEVIGNIFDNAELLESEE